MPQCGACKDHHDTNSQVWECYSGMWEAEAEQRAEIHAEAVMSWVMGGGSQADASRYADVIASGGTWNGGIDETPLSGKLCDHGLALELCEGPQHYPLDV